MNIEIAKWVKLGQKYGVIFNNVTLKGIDNTFVFYVIEKEKEIHLKVPKSMLLSAENIEITDTTHRVSKNLDIPSDLRDFLNEYLAYVLSQERIEKQIELINGFKTLSDELKMLTANYGFDRFLEALSLAQIKQILLQSRMMKVENQKMLMPFIDFLNHDSKVGIGYVLNDNSVTIKGSVSTTGEVYTVYNRLLDSFFYLSTYYFVPRAENAYGMGVTINIDKNTQLEVGRNADGYVFADDNLMKVKHHTTKNKISIERLWLGCTVVPQKPFWSFKAFWEGELHRTDTLRIYTILKSINVTRLVQMVRLCDASTQNITVKLIKECALQQLTIIGESYES